ncbi:hypothetical protein KAFR_0C03930 [Kazachstania africana CBS 2517]|uniref:Mitochondrial resolvase Ydc2 catalytic domain-containing protein n=1 Tax=Kazachstania africana (strain ATCC 22294 / BCRC 22015 / CBS 2517 / CECT 1963 / NBRC 1671 / NRRL Y-8276) TaxID=1071382 RepID=H2ASN4_KAZAF|nr:hypothetical protein KAFR_0C03930 [Kazachstania africana CBS 2517]CCF57384.1 hypothetical protein KAFR_0C03930 [Kazachstania africana CBS 2517]
MTKNTRILQSICNNLNSNALKLLSNLIGSPTGTTKLVKATNIISQLNLLSRLQNNGNRSTIISIDNGISNFAYATFHIGEKIKLNQWNKLQLPSDNTGSLSPEETHNIVEFISKKVINTNDHIDLITLERQRTRTVSSKFISNQIIKVNILEHVLFNHLTSDYYQVQSSDPSRMTKFWCGDLNNSINSKTARIKVAKKFILSNLVSHDFQIDQSKKKIYDWLQLSEQNGNGPRKDDDLADCFLHGLSWSTWFQTHLEIKKMIDDNIHDDIKTLSTLLTDYCIEKSAKQTHLQQKLLQ